MQLFEAIKQQWPPADETFEEHRYKCLADCGERPREMELFKDEGNGKGKDEGKGKSLERESRKPAKLGALKFELGVCNVRAGAPAAVAQPDYPTVFGAWSLPAHSQPPSPELGPEPATPGHQFPIDFEHTFPTNARRAAPEAPGEHRRHRRSQNSK